MKHIIIAALLLTLVLGSLRGAEKQHGERGNRRGESSVESSVSYSGSNEYSGPSSYDGDYSSDDDDSEYSGPSSYSDDDDEYSGSSNSYSGSSYESDDDSEYSGSYDSSESSDDEYSEQEESHRGRRGGRGGRGCQGKEGRQGRRPDHDDERKPHPHPDPFAREVIGNLKKTGRVILEEWKVSEDPVLKNEIRALLIQNLENLLPVAEDPVEPVDPVNPPQPVETQQPEHPHPKPHPKPQPEDEFAQQVFETLHQIGEVVLEQWNVEQDVDTKNQIRANVIQQLSDLIPEQQVEQSTTILEVPDILEVNPLPVARMTEENGN